MAVPEGYGVAENIQQILGSVNPERYELIAASRGGFARTDPALMAFIAECEEQSGVPFEPLYTGKALLALRQAIEAGRFAKGSRLIFVHTGGLQGNRR
jgi:1-aminocyclopropane-1-carboxylate deaminase